MPLHRAVHSVSIVVALEFSLSSWARLLRFCHNNKNRRYITFNPWYTSVQWNRRIWTLYVVRCASKVWSLGISGKKNWPIHIKLRNYNSSNMFSYHSSLAESNNKLHYITTGVPENWPRLAGISGKYFRTASCWNWFLASKMIKYGQLTL